MSEHHIILKIETERGCPRIVVVVVVLGHIVTADTRGLRRGLRRRLRGRGRRTADPRRLRRAEDLAPAAKEEP